MLERLMADMYHALYLIQDTRSYVGNCVVWWGPDGRGYTTDVDVAGRYTFDEAMRQHRSRETDLPWALADIRELTRKTVDVQDVYKTLGSNSAQVAALTKLQKLRV